MIENEKVLRGVMTLLILGELLEKPLHGYALQSKVSAKLGTAIPPGTIYVLLGSLQKRGFVDILERKIVSGRKTTVYEITENGKIFLINHEEPLTIVRGVLDNLLESIGKLSSSTYVDG